MSKNLSAAAKKEFDSRYIEDFQAEGGLRDMVHYIPNVKGKSYRFNVYGQGVASQKAAGEDVPLMGLDIDLPEVTLSPWYASELTDYFENEEAPHEEKEALISASTKALKRREDQVILDILNAKNYTGKQLVAAGGTGFTVAKVKSVASVLNKLEVDPEDRVFVADYDAQEELLNSVEVTSSDYVKVQALIDGRVDRFMGFKFKFVGDRKEGGLKAKSGKRVAYAYSKKAIGIAVGHEITTEIDWIPMKDAWLVKGKVRVGAQLLLPNSIIEVQADPLV